MRVLEGARQRRENRHGLVRGQPLLAFEPRAQRFTLHQFRDQERHASLLARIENAHDSRVVEATGEIGLAQETAAERGIGRELRPQLLECDVRQTARDLGAMDHRRAAAPERLDHG